MSGKGANKKDVKSVIISGTSSNPSLKEEPINMSNTHEYVMQYTDIFGTENGADVVDIQEGDTISDCSDTEIVAHSNEQSNYEGHSDSENESDGEYREGPPPLPDSDDESDVVDHHHNDLPQFSGVDVEEDVGEWDYEGTHSILPVDNYSESPPPLPTADDSDNSIHCSDSPPLVPSADSDYGSNVMDELENSEHNALTIAREHNADLDSPSNADDTCEENHLTPATSDDDNQGDENERTDTSDEDFQEVQEEFEQVILTNEGTQSSDETEIKDDVTGTLDSECSEQIKGVDSVEEIQLVEKVENEYSKEVIEEFQEVSNMVESQINHDEDDNEDDNEQYLQKTKKDDQEISEQKSKLRTSQELSIDTDSGSEKKIEDNPAYHVNSKVSVLGHSNDERVKTKDENKHKNRSVHSSKELSNSDADSKLQRGKLQTKYPGTAVKSDPKEVSSVLSSSSQVHKEEGNKGSSQRTAPPSKTNQHGKTGNRKSELGVKSAVDLNSQKTINMKVTREETNRKEKHKVKPQNMSTSLDLGSLEKVKKQKGNPIKSETTRGLREIKNETDEYGSTPPFTRHETGRKHERRSMSTRLAAAAAADTDKQVEKKKVASQRPVSPQKGREIAIGNEQKPKPSRSVPSVDISVDVYADSKTFRTTTTDISRSLKTSTASGKIDSEVKVKSSSFVSSDIDEKDKNHVKMKRPAATVSKSTSSTNTETIQKGNKQSKSNKRSKTASVGAETISIQNHKPETEEKVKMRSKDLESNAKEEAKMVRPSSVSVAVGTDNDVCDEELDDEIMTRRSDQTPSSKFRTKFHDDRKNGQPYSNHSQKDKSLQKNPVHEKQKKSEHSHRHHHQKHDRKKHVWLCRDDEIHKLIAQKASMLKEYETGSLAGRRVFSGRKSVDNLDEISGVPDVSFVGKKPKNSRTTRPVSELIQDNRLQKKENRRSLQHQYPGSSSEDEDERTNRSAGNMGRSSGSTFAVGLASRKFVREPEQEDESDHEETCEYCLAEKAEREAKKRNPAWEGPHHPRNLLLGVVYSCKYLGSTQIMSPQSPNRAVRMQQAQEAMGRIKVPEGEDQPTTDVDVFISTERLKVVNAASKEVMMDHSLRNVSFIADIGDILVLMARRDASDKDKDIEAKPSQILASIGTGTSGRETIKITCHVFQSEEAQLLAKSIGQAFNVAYQEFLKKNGLSEESVEDAEYSGILEAQKILGEDLYLLADESKAKERYLYKKAKFTCAESNANEVIVNKKPAEMLGVMIVESGWGSMIPTAIIAHLAKDGAAAKSGQLNVGDQILAVNGTSFVGLPLTDCQTAIKNTRPGTKVVLKIVSCPPTVQVSVNRPDTKYQLGFSVQNGMICSLMRGSIAERGGVRVGHRIIEINGESVVATSHQRIVELLATTIGEIRMKTMPAAMYRLLVGLDTPVHI